MTERRSDGLALVARAKAIGWETKRQKGGAWKIIAPNGETSVSVHASPSDVNVVRVWTRALRAMGFFEAEKEHEEKRQAERDARAKQEQAAAARAAATLEKQAQALHKASGGTVVTADKLLVPHSVPTRYPRVLITPAMAERLLDNNTNNRKLDTRRAARVAAQITAGKWIYTGDTIRLDTSGVLLDGQHRLAGVVEAGQPIETDVMCGLPPEVFHVVDTGKPRTAADSLIMLGETSVLAMSATIRLVHRYQQGPTHNEWLKQAHTLSNLDIARTMAADDATAERFRDAAAMGDRMHRAAKVNRTAASTWWFLVSEIYGAADPRLIEFQHRVCDGVGLVENSPVHTLRRTIMLAERKKAPEILAVLIKAWNGHVQGREIKNLAWRADESMPSIFVPPPD